jgi:inorganic pyrophosphatase
MPKRIPRLFWLLIGLLPIGLGLACSNDAREADGPRSARVTGGVERSDTAQGADEPDGTLFLERNYVDDFEPTNEDGTINVAVEMPAGTNEEWEVAWPSGRLERELRDGKPRTIAYLGCPGNYGMIPGTLVSAEVGGDGDPLDVLLIGGPVPRGSVVAGRLIGVLRIRDEGERDDKLLAVLPGTALGTVGDLAALERKFPGVTSIIETWFVNYTVPGETVSEGLGSIAEAREILRRAVTEYLRSRGVAEE